MKRLYILTLCTLLVAAGIFFFKKRIPATIATREGLVVKKEWLVQNKNPLTPEKDCRPADQTFLTYPEWYLVFSPEEQAGYFRKYTASSFPFKAHTAQIWQSYKIVNDQIKDVFPTNTGYHFMIWVIGSSATVEYSIKSLYETLVGRITDTHEVQTAEDQFNATFTQDYVTFIKDRPWYEFDFKSQLKTLWTSTAFFGDHFLRKIERRYILTAELLVKYVYGKLIGLGTKTVYDEALPTTAVVTAGDSLQYLPRYDRFAAAATALVKKGEVFKEIAGNQSAILLTVLVPADYNTAFDDAQIIFIQPLASDPAQKRLGIATPVTSLHQLLLQIEKEKIRLEHVFDY
jgi:hypothetical protein